MKFKSNENSFFNSRVRVEILTSVSQNLSINIIENKFRIEYSMRVSPNLTRGHEFGNREDWNSLKNPRPTSEATPKARQTVSTLSLKAEKWINYVLLPKQPQPYEYSVYASHRSVNSTLLRTRLSLTPSSSLLGEYVQCSLFLGITMVFCKLQDLNGVQRSWKNV